jgi:hypothetical protein
MNINFKENEEKIQIKKAVMRKLAIIFFNLENNS